MHIENIGDANVPREGKDGRAFKGQRHIKKEYI